MVKRCISNWNCKQKKKKCKPLEVQIKILPMLRQTKQIAYYSKFSRGEMQIRECFLNCEVSDLQICFGKKKVHAHLWTTEKQKCVVFFFLKADDNYIENMLCNIYYSKYFHELSNGIIR